jgi:hypothetical protein
LNFVGKHGIVASNGNTIGKIDGLTLVGDQPVQFSGINAYSNAAVNLGSNMIIQGFWCGIITRGNATVYAEGVTVRGCVTGLNCADSTIYASNSLIEDNEHWCLNSFRTGFIQVDNAIIRNNAGGAIAVGAVSIVQAKNASISGTTQVDSKGALIQ